MQIIQYMNEYYTIVSIYEPENYIYLKNYT